MFSEKGVTMEVASHPADVLHLTPAPLLTGEGFPALFPALLSLSYCTA